MKQEEFFELYTSAVNETQPNPATLWQARVHKHIKRTRASKAALLAQRITNHIQIGTREEIAMLSEPISAFGMDYYVALDDLDSLFEQIGSTIRFAVIYLTNNHVAKIPCDHLYRLFISEDICVIGRDFDNHHWTIGSKLLALSSDVYAPAHRDNHGVALTYGTMVVDSVPTGVTQWSYEFIQSKIKFLPYKRADGPLGKHYFYQNFTLRNSLVSHLSKWFKDVSLHQHDYHGSTHEARWSEWISYKTHWIVPVSHDLPIRFFDALVTGGIPIICSDISSYIDMIGVPQRFYCSYSPNDVFSPEDVVVSAIKMFDDEGLEGMVSRALYTLSKFHYSRLSRYVWDAYLRRILRGI